MWPSGRIQKMANAFSASWACFLFTQMLSPGLLYQWPVLMIGSFDFDPRFLSCYPITSTSRID